jgi:predicted nucleic acid-binding protein
MKVLVDTNILLDVLTQRQPHYVPAASLWALAEIGQIKAFVSAISFNNVYYIVCKAAGRKQAEEALRLVRGIFEAVPVDGQLLNQAIDAGLNDFEDAVQYFSALRAGADYFVTRNPDHFPAPAVGVVSAQELLAIRASNEA